MLLVTLAALLAAGTALADPPGPASDGERLRPGLYPAAPVPEGFGVPAEPGHPPFDIDWSIGLKGTLTGSTDGSSFVTTLTPQFTAIHEGRRTDLAIEGQADLARPQDGRIEVPALRLGLSSTTALDRRTRLSGRAALELSRQLPGTPGLDPRIIEPPHILTGAIGAGIERRFGRFNLGVNGDLSRTAYGPTTRTDSGLTDNSDQNVWSGEARLRLGYQATPILEVFGEAALGRDWLDRPAPGLGLRTDATGRALRAGLAGKWNGILSASASIGVGQHDFDAPGIADITTRLYDARVTFTPDPTLNLTAALSTGIEPTGADSAGTARVSHRAVAEIDYTVNSWLRLRASADWGHSTLEGSDETERRHGFGAGADYRLGKHTALAADYRYGHSDNSRRGVFDAHTVSLGITLRR